MTWQLTEVSLRSKEDFGEPQEVWKFDEDSAQGADLAESYLTVFPVIFTVELQRESICC